MIKISVVVPVYNVEHYLDNCLSSLVNQTLKDIEIIVVNDGSADRSKSIIDKYAKKYKNVIAIHKENEGISVSRNIGIEKSSGEYIAFLDSDDSADLEMYEKMYKFAKKEKLDMVVTDYIKMYSDSSVVEEKIPSFPVSSVYKMPELLFNINAGAGNKLFKRTLFNKTRYPRIKYEDLAVFPELLINSKQIGKIDEPLWRYTIRGNSETGIVDNRVFDIIKVVDDINGYLEKIGFKKEHYSEVEYFVINKLILYSIQQRVQRNKETMPKFIDAAYKYMNDFFPNWKNNKYLKKRNKLKLTVQKHKLAAKIYCNWYRKTRRVQNEKTR